MTRILFATALFVFAGLVNAQSAQPAPAPSEPAQTEPAAQPEMVVTAPPAQSPGKARTCLRSTGSRVLIAQNARAEKQGKPERCSGSAGRTYTGDELQSTGHTNIADALRTLDPSIH